VRRKKKKTQNFSQGKASWGDAEGGCGGVGSEFTHERDFETLQRNSCANWEKEARNHAGKKVSLGQGRDISWWGPKEEKRRRVVVSSYLFKRGREINSTFRNGKGGKKKGGR